MKGRQKSELEKRGWMRWDELRRVKKVNGIDNDWGG
jgi:hypothetical protein